MIKLVAYAINKDGFLNSDTEAVVAESPNKDLICKIGDLITSSSDIYDDEQIPDSADHIEIVAVDFKENNERNFIVYQKRLPIGGEINEQGCC